MPAADLDLTDAALHAAMANGIAELRSRFPETRALYREVCGLLFFRYGVTPTANKLYSLVRKGSMGTPAEVLQAFWQELRGRTRVTIDHPDLPDALKDIAAGAVQTVWQAANEAATGELATLRAEARAAASAAEAERDAARTETTDAREEVAAISAQLAEAREAHAATQARLEAGRAELDAAGRQLAELRTQFSTELERAREQVTIAQERAEASERRSLREPDGGRTARQQSERTAEALRGELLAARSEARDAAVAQAEVRARLEAQAAALTERLTERLAAAEQAKRKSAHVLDAVQAELGAAQRRAERAEAEAALARQLLAELRVAPPGRGGVVAGGGARPGARRRPNRRRQAKNWTNSKTRISARLRPPPTRMTAATAVTTAMTAKSERAAATRWIQAEMADYGLTMEELEAAGCFDPPPPPPPAPAPVICYRNAAGQSWDGQGEMPDWLRRAVNAGQSKEFFPVG